MNPDVYEILLNAARRWPARPALIDELGALDYGALLGQVEALGARLRELGVSAGQGIGVRARNGRSFIIAAFAALGCGAVVMPVDPRLKRAELAELLQRAPLHALLDEAGGPGPAGERALTLDLSAAPPLRLAWTGRARDERFIPQVAGAAFVRFTSGTTGAAKGVILSHQGVLERIGAANSGLQLTSDDVVLWVLPMAFHFFVSIVLYLSVGAAIVISPDHLAETLLGLANRHGATFFYGAPLHFRLLAADRSGRRLATLRRAMSTSSGLPTTTARAFLERYGLPVSQAYGIIEVGLPIMNLTDQVEHPEAIGRVLPAYEAAILDEALRPLPDGQAGQLALRGPGMFSAYLWPPRPREAALHEGWFLTGDLARRSPAGLITIAGRCKSLINVAGHKVFPEEVAAVLEGHPQVARARISSRPHPQLGEVVHAEVMTCDGARDSELKEALIAFCRERLTGYKVPQAVEFVETIAETPSGKVRHGGAHDNTFTGFGAKEESCSQRHKDSKATKKYP